MYPYIGAPGEIRTPTTRNLNPVPLPVGLQGQTLAILKGIEPSSTLRQRVSLTRCLQDQISVLVTAIQRCLSAQQVLRQDGSSNSVSSGGRNLYPPMPLEHRLGGDAKDLIPSNYGAPTKIRTPDLLITNQLLYQLSYKGKTRGMVLCTQASPSHTIPYAIWSLVKDSNLRPSVS